MRNKLMSTRSIICTGNPNKFGTLAHGLKKIFPLASFIHQSNGWDLTDMTNDAVKRLETIFKKHNTFINASYIAPDVQSNLLDICNQSVKIYDVVNIGSTHEFDGGGHPDYVISKINLREQSLKLNTYRFRTHHLIVGGIQTDNSLEKQDLLPIAEICNMIQYIWSQTVSIPLMCIQSQKSPW